MIYKEYRPHLQLLPFIECYWSADADMPPFRDQKALIPDGTIELMFNFGDDYMHLKNGVKIPVNGSHIIGIRKQALWISQTQHQHIFSVRFKLGGAYPFVKIPVHLFAHGFYDIDELLPRDYKELEQLLFEAKDHDGRVLIADQFFIERLKYVPAEQLFTIHCSRILFQNPIAKIQDAAHELHTSYKTLERRFAQVTGLSPSEILKIRRFNNAILAMYSGKFSSLTQIAYACGFYDQSHFIREFRQLAGYAPRTFLKKQFTIIEVIQPALAERMSKLYNS